MSSILGLCLEPLDVLFFRDGRPFTAGAHGASELPLPQTLAGALWTALLQQHGCDVGRFAKLLKTIPDAADAIEAAGGPRWIADLHVRGPWLARREQSNTAGVSAGLEVLVPTPAVLHATKGEVSGEAEQPLHRLRPLRSSLLPGWEISEWHEQHALRPLWLKNLRPTEPAGGFLIPNGLRTFLAGKNVYPSDVVQSGDLYAFDRRTGIGIDPDRLSAEEGLIYAASFLSLKPGVCFYAEAVLPEGIDRKSFDGLKTLTFGGESRRVQLGVLKEDQRFQWPEGASSQNANANPNEKPLLLLTTPGLFAGRWKPSALNGQLIAAAVPGAVPVSGWDLAKAGPKPTRFAAAAGSVYFLNALPQPLPRTLSDVPFHQRQGWGCFVQGVWNDV